jgi:hypothetical protein
MYIPAGDRYPIFTDREMRVWSRTEDEGGETNGVQSLDTDTIDWFDEYYVFSSVDQLVAAIRE